MSKLLAVLAILLIITGVVLLAVPKLDSDGTRGLAPEAIAAPTLINQVRGIAETVNAPLSILCGLVSLFYSRRTYLVNKERAEAAKIGRSV
jgi:hypothetical protein